MERRLAAVLMTDLVGYSRLMEADEAGTLAAVKERQASVLEPTFRSHGGRIVKLMGDGALVEFGSAVKRRGRNGNCNTVTHVAASDSRATGRKPAQRGGNAPREAAMRPERRQWAQGAATERGRNEDDE